MDTREKVMVFQRPLQVDCKVGLNKPTKRMTTGYIIRYRDGSTEEPMQRKALYEFAQKRNLLMSFANR